MPPPVQLPEDVHCRTGSLERHIGTEAGEPNVHCRTGSLESKAELAKPIAWCALPYRQLRNMPTEIEMPLICALPYRQLRKLEG